MTTVYTDLAVIDITEGGPVVREMVDGLDLEGLQALTGTRLALDPDCKPLAPPVL